MTQQFAPSDLERLVHAAQKADWNATNILNKWIHETPPQLVGNTIIQILGGESKDERTIFYALTALQQTADGLSIAQRAQARQLICYQSSNSFNTTPKYMLVKRGVVMATLLRKDFEYQEFQSRASPQLYLQTLDALFTDQCSEEVRLIKDYVRGYFLDFSNPEGSRINPPVDLSKTLSVLIVNTTLQYLRQYPTLALRVFSLLVSWVDMSLVRGLMPSLWEYLGEGHDPKEGELVMESLSELVSRGALAPDEVPSVLAEIVQRVNLQTLDASPVEVVIAVAKFTNSLGCESEAIDVSLLQVFYHCFVYDDIDVSGAVIPFASKLVAVHGEANGMNGNDSPLPQILEIMFRQMRYPTTFDLLNVDPDDDVAAEEEMYRADLRKLYQKIVRTNPDLSLQCVVQALASLPTPISTSATPDVEVALRLVFHYCEGVRPSPGLKVVMKNETFCAMLVALHQSDICQHEHPQILLLYYDICVRYSTIFLSNQDLLPPVLIALSGPQGLQAAHSAKVRARSCYLLLKLVGNVVSIMTPIVKDVVTGIQSYLSSSGTELRQDDALYLFETIGLLLGKTSLPTELQVLSLKQVMLPHVQRIQNLLAQAGQEQPLDADQEEDEIGDMLAHHILAIAYLTKGFPKPCAPEIQLVLSEMLDVTSRVLGTRARHSKVRKNCVIVWQRLIQCYSVENLLLTMKQTVTPHFLSILIRHAENPEDLFDISQMMNQSCMKFKAEAPLDEALLPFLQKCHDLTPQDQRQNGQNVPRHFVAEQLEVKRLVYIVLHHIVQNDAATNVLLSPSNSTHLESILLTISDGCVRIVEQQTIQKTCLVFFRMLIEKWGNDKSQEAAHSYLCQFCDRQLIPGMLETCCTKLDINDAMQARVLQEFAKLLLTLKSAGGNRTLSSIPVAFLSSFEAADTAKAMTLFLRQVINSTGA